MAIPIEANQKQGHLANGSAEIERLNALVSRLQEECAGLRLALTQAKNERDQYRHLFLQHARAAREFENLDIPTLEAMSAGPVEMME